MVDSATLAFLRDLGRHNSKDWFEKHRDRYDQANADLVSIASLLIEKADRYDDRVRATETDPAKCLTRIRRDPRFARGKPPYKTDVVIMLNSHPVRTETAGYFLHVEPGNCYAGASYFITQAKRLGRVRNRIVERFDEWTSIVEDRMFKAAFPQGLESPSTLKTAPRGFDPDDPAIEYLRMQGFGAHHRMTDRDLEGEGALKAVLQAMKAARPFVDFINAAVEDEE